VKEIASKFASADFQNCCRLASKKMPKVPVFFGLEGTLLPLYIKLIQVMGMPSTKWKSRYDSGRKYISNREKTFLWLKKISDGSALQERQWLRGY